MSFDLTAEESAPFMALETAPLGMSFYALVARLSLDPEEDFDGVDFTNCELSDSPEGVVFTGTYCANPRNGS